MPSGGRRGSHRWAPSDPGVKCSAHRALVIRLGLRPLVAGPPIAGVRGCTYSPGPGPLLSSHAPTYSTVNGCAASADGERRVWNPSTPTGARPAVARAGHPPRVVGLRISGIRHPRPRPSIVGTRPRRAAASGRCRRCRGLGEGELRRGCQHPLSHLEPVGERFHAVCGSFCCGFGTVRSVPQRGWGGSPLRWWANCRVMIMVVAHSTMASWCWGRRS